MAKIRYANFEPAELVFLAMANNWNCKEVGCYWLIICHLYINRGRLIFNKKNLRKLANCERNFDKVWEAIGGEFEVTAGYLYHKNVTEDIRRIKNMIKQKSESGRLGAQKRWGQGKSKSANDSRANGRAKSEAIPNEKVTKKECNDKDNFTKAHHQASDELSNINDNFTKQGASISQLTSSITFQSETLSLTERLRAILPPRSQSDKTCLANVARWFYSQKAAGVFDDSTRCKILEHATRCGSSSASRPAALFMSILKKEFNYGKNKKN